MRDFLHVICLDWMLLLLPTFVNWGFVRLSLRKLSVGLAGGRCVAGGFSLLSASLLFLQVLAPSEVNQDQIEDGQQHEKDRMGVRVAVHLVDTENSEHDHRKRISPELIHPQTEHKQSLRQAVGDQVDGREHFAAVRERLRQMKKVR